MSSTALIAALLSAFFILILLRLTRMLRGERVRMVVVKEVCNGCGNCVVACPANAIREGVAGGKGESGADMVIQIGRGTAVEVDLSRCERVKNPGAEHPCRACVDACPMDAIEFTY